MSADDEPPRRRRVTEARPAGGPSRGGLTERVKTARGRKTASTDWLKRQLNDPYVRRAQAKGYRARSAFKLAELDDRFSLISKGARVVDLGAAPGGWAQVSLERGAGSIIGVDVLEMDPMPGAIFLLGDFTDAETVEAVRGALGGEADLVLSDMAANTTGHRATDHVRIVALAEAAADFAGETLRPGGAFVAKVLQGGTEGGLLAKLKRTFKDVRHAKPPASRADSAETYLVARGFRGER